MSEGVYGQSGTEQQPAMKYEDGSVEVSKDWQEHFEEMASGTGLEQDIMNNWGLPLMAIEEPDFFSELKPQPHYEDFFRTAFGQDGLIDALGEQVLKHSRP